MTATNSKTHPHFIIIRSAQECLMSMIRFLKDVYLTGFTIVFRISRAKAIGYKVGGACAILTLVEWFNLVNISSWLDIFAGKELLPRFSEPEVLLAGFVFFSINVYVLFTLRHGIKFEREFDYLAKSRKILLVTSCVVLLLATIVFSIYSISAHRHFIQEMTATK